MTGALDEELAALAKMSSAQLREEWQRVFGKPAPAFSPDLLELALGYELQAQRFGDLPMPVRRKIERLARDYARTGEVAAREPTIRPGTRLSRDWHGRTHHVLAVEDGFLFEQRRYSSLSQVASAITGTRWSGPRFFGLTTRSKPVEARNG